MDPTLAEACRKDPLAADLTIEDLDRSDAFAMALPTAHIEPAERI
ncbi:hypothetical protein [Thermoactinospora rubra]|nr:hypothetical protein [Thermoactinospora rubra]